MAHECGNPLLRDWVEEWMIEYQSMQSKAYFTYRKAFTSLKQCPTPFDHPSEAEQLPGIGPSISGKLTKRMEEYCVANGLPIPIRRKKSRRGRNQLSATDDTASGSGTGIGIGAAVPARRARPARPYVPKYRSGAYAIMLCLLELKDQGFEHAVKEDIIRLGQPNCDASFDMPETPGSNFTAWNSMKTLREKSMVWQHGTPARYRLTEAGEELARHLRANKDGNPTSLHNQSNNSSQTDENTRQEQNEQLRVNRRAAAEASHASPSTSTRPSTSNAWPSSGGATLGAPGAWQTAIQGGRGRGGGSRGGRGGRGADAPTNGRNATNSTRLTPQPIETTTIVNGRRTTTVRLSDQQRDYEENNDEEVDLSLYVLNPEQFRPSTSSSTPTSPPQQRTRTQPLSSSRPTPQPIETTTIVNGRRTTTVRLSDQQRDYEENNDEEVDLSLYVLNPEQFRPSTSSSTPTSPQQQRTRAPPSSSSRPAHNLPIDTEGWDLEEPDVVDQYLTMLENDREEEERRRNSPAAPSPSRLPLYEISTATNSVRSQTPVLDMTTSHCISPSPSRESLSPSVPLARPSLRTNQGQQQQSTKRTRDDEQNTRPNAKRAAGTASKTGSPASSPLSQRVVPIASRSNRIELDFDNDDDPTDHETRTTYASPSPRLQLPARSTSNAPKPRKPASASQPMRSAPSFLATGLADMMDLDDDDIDLTLLGHDTLASIAPAPPAPVSSSAPTADQDIIALLSPSPPPTSTNDTMSHLSFDYTFLDADNNHVRHAAQACVKIHPSGVVMYKIKYDSSQVATSAQYLEEDQRSQCTAFVKEIYIDVVCPGLPKSPWSNMVADDGLAPGIWPPPSPDRDASNSQNHSQPTTIGPLRRQTTITEAAVRSASIAAAPSPTSSVATPSTRRPTTSSPTTPEISKLVEDIRRDARAWQPQDYQIMMVLDVREVKMKNNRDYIQQTLASKGVHVVTRAMDLGDVLWIAKHRATNEELFLDIVVERKRLDDLLYSIKDGRYMEQKYRLKNSSCRKVIYVIEEYNKEALLKGSINAQTVRTSMASIQAVDNFYLKRTTSLDETIDYLVTTTKMVQLLYKDKVLYEIPPRLVNKETYHHAKTALNREPFLISYSMFNQMNSKSGSTTLRDLQIRMLMTIRGISAEKAIALARHYPTPQSLLKKMNEVENAEEGKRVAIDATRDGIQRKRWTPLLSQRLWDVWGQ
ncbi:hypothetical protein BC940DRAFT_302209 [Gongronella butleri]|nr:hypothetical protein BC940DRAFT_302209 [Gongronella butleri]